MQVRVFLINVFDPVSGNFYRVFILISIVLAPVNLTVLSMAKHAHFGEFLVEPGDSRHVLLLKLDKFYELLLEYLTIHLFHHRILRQKVEHSRDGVDFLTKIVHSSL